MCDLSFHLGESAYCPIPFLLELPRKFLDHCQIAASVPSYCSAVFLGKVTADERYSISQRRSCSKVPLKLFYSSTSYFVWPSKWKMNKAMANERPLSLREFRQCNIESQLTSTSSKTRRLDKNRSHDKASHLSATRWLSLKRKRKRGIRIVFISSNDLQIKNDALSNLWNKFSILFSNSCFKELFPKNIFVSIVSEEVKRMKVSKVSF